MITRIGLGQCAAALCAAVILLTCLNGAAPAAEGPAKEALKAGGAVEAFDAASGKAGTVAGFLWVVSPADSKKLIELPLDSPPVYHGLAPAGGRLYVSLQDGSVVCFGKAE